MNNENASPANVSFNEKINHRITQITRIISRNPLRSIRSIRWQKTFPEKMNHRIKRITRIISWKPTSLNSLNSMTKTPSPKTMNHRITQIKRIISWKTPSFNSINSMTKTPSPKTMNHRIKRITRIISKKNPRHQRSIFQSSVKCHNSAWSPSKKTIKPNWKPPSMMR